MELRHLKSKKAQEGGATIGTVVTIILLMILAGFLLYWIITGSNPFSQLLKNIIPVNSNSASVISGCNSKCGTDLDAYCKSVDSGIIFSDKTKYKGNCLTLLGLPKAVDAGLKACSDSAWAGGCKIYSFKKCDDFGGAWNEKKCVAPAKDLTNQINDDSDKSADYAKWSKQIYCCTSSDKLCSQKKDACAISTSKEITQADCDKIKPCEFVPKSDAAATVVTAASCKAPATDPCVAADAQKTQADCESAGGAGAICEWLGVKV